MEPKLVVLSGPRQGESYVLPGEEVILGRDGTWLPMPDASASRKHCAIAPCDTGFRIRDLGSRNGTFVNRQRIQERVLQDGDCIEIGGSMFLYRSEEEAAAATPQTAVSPAFVRTTLRARIEDILNLQPDQFTVSPFPPARVASALKVFWDIASCLTTEKEPASLCHRILASVLEFVSADTAGILLSSPDNTEFPESYFSDQNASAHKMDVNVALQVLRSGAGVIAEHSDGAVKRSILCVPLVLPNKVTGVLYLQTAAVDAAFDDDQLRVLTTMGAITAAALESRRTISHLENENRLLRADLHHSMIGDSPAMEEVYAFIRRAAPVDSTVLILGETGTGKELAARAIHQNSPRAEQPFVAINCATLSETLLESELFGHERGAFTGAVSQKKGKLELADHGTVFLDEVGEIPLSLQSKLLRFLQERQFERIGGTRSIRIDVRLIAATNKDLSAAVRSGSFREDLFYRLNVLTLTMPPLRKRAGDIPLLTQYFTEMYGQKLKRRVVKISQPAQRCLLFYPWPGNVRELENAIEHAVVMGSGQTIEAEDLPDRILEAQPIDVPISNYHEGVKQAKRSLILKALGQAENNYTQAAKALGLHPNNLHRLIRDLDLKSAVRKDE